MALFTNCTPFAVDEFVGYDHDGAEFYTLVVKAAYTWDQRGQLTLTREPPPIYPADVYAGDPASAAGPLLATEHVPGKPRLDVLVAGKIALPAAVPQIDCTLMVGHRLRKTVRVYGDRFFMPGFGGVSTDRPRPFQEMPIQWERCYGGTDPAHPNTFEPRNPVGRGVRRREAELHGTPAPNFVDPSGSARPAGFGPIAPHWQPRVKLAGTYDKRWEDERFPLLPVDFDSRFYCAAPEDQQLAGYMPGEEVQLTYMSRSGHDRFALPHFEVPVTVVQRLGVLHKMVATPDTIIIEPAEHRVSIVAHARYSPRPDMFVMRNVLVGALSRGRQRALDVDKRYVDLRGAHP
jgi:hypothetical protein